ASFGATAGLAAFWRGCGYRPVRLGMRRDPASGAHSLVVLRPLDAAAAAAAAELRTAFADQLPWLLGDGLQDVETDLVAELVAGMAPLPPGPRDRQALARYTAGAADYAQALAALRRATWNLLAAGRAGQLAARDLDLLVGRLLQQRGWAALAAEYDLAGRRGVERELRGVVARVAAGLADG
ncbi:MAG: hypothetical protein P8106_05570, partial [Gammaproteobacteria bacterium]